MRSKPKDRTIKLTFTSKAVADRVQRRLDQAAKSDGIYVIAGRMTTKCQRKHQNPKNTRRRR